MKGPNSKPDQTRWRIRQCRPSKPLQGMRVSGGGGGGGDVCVCGGGGGVAQNEYLH